MPELQPVHVPAGMKQLVCEQDNAVPICHAVHCMMSIPPIVNYLCTTALLAADLQRKRVNAANFTQEMSSLAREYWHSQKEVVDATAAVCAFRKIHRTVHVSAAAAVRHMYQAFLDATGEEGGFFKQLGGAWVVHEPDCKADTVQQLLNTQQMEGLPHLFFVRLDRGDRVRRVIDYGTSVQVVKQNKRNIEFHLYNLAAAVLQGPEESRVFALTDSQWELADGQEPVRPVTDLSSIVSTRAQVLAFLRQL